MNVLKKGICKPINKVECPTVFGYFGGKYTMSRTLVDWIPEHTNYIELFAGGLSMFFRKPKAKWNLVNDLNKDITNIYWILAHEHLKKEFFTQVYYLINSRYIYDLSIEEIGKDFDFPNVRRAVMYLFHISTSFNKIIETGFAVNHTNWNTDLLNTIELSRKKLDNVIVENRDYREIIKAHKCKKDTFWYIDPPYVVADKEEYYKYNFENQDDHYTLKYYIKEIIKNSNAKIMISYDDLPIVRKIYSEEPFIITDFKTTYASNSTETNELVITNYPIPNSQAKLFEM